MKKSVRIPASAAVIGAFIPLVAWLAVPDSRPIMISLPVSAIGALIAGGRSGYRADSRIEPYQAVARVASTTLRTT